MRASIGQPSSQPDRQPQRARVRIFTTIWTFAAISRYTKVGELVMSKSSNRSFERITDIDLRRLSALAAADFDDLFRRIARWRPYRRRLMLLCLCQGAALHYASPRRGMAADRSGGVNDFDV